MNKSMRQRLRSVVEETPADSFARRVATAKPITLRAQAIAEGKGTAASKALGRLVTTTDAATKAIPSHSDTNDLLNAMTAVAKGASRLEWEAIKPFMAKVEETKATLEEAKGVVTVLWSQVNELTAMWPGLPASVTGREPSAKESPQGKASRTHGTWRIFPHSMG